MLGIHADADISHCLDRGGAVTSDCGNSRSSSCRSIRTTALVCRYVCSGKMDGYLPVNDAGEYDVDV